MPESLAEVQDLERQKQEERHSMPGQPQKPAKVEFDARQQEKVQQLIREAQGRASREKTSEIQRLQAELAAARSVAPRVDDGAATLANDLAVARAEIAALKQNKTESILNAELLAAASSHQFIDPQLAARVMRDHVRVGEDGKVHVIGPDGVRMNQHLEPMSVDDLAREFSQSHSFMVRTSVRSGSGSVESKTYQPPLQLERLFGKNSNAEMANRLAKADPKKYASLRRQAREQGLL